MTSSLVAMPPASRLRGSLGAKLVLLAGVAILATTVPAAMLAGRFAGDAILEDTRAVMGQKAELVGDSLAVYEGSARSAAERLHRTFLATLAGEITVVAGRTTRVGEFDTPALRAGGTPLDPSDTAVDRFNAATGGVATVFARVGEDFVRVSTSVRKEDGSRAVGTALDRAHPAWRRALDGEEFTGRAMLFGTDYMTRYVPFRDASGEVAGVTFIGYDISAGLEALKERVEAARLGERGYFTVVDARPGAGFGALVVHPTAAGSNLSGLLDVDGQPYLKGLVEAGEGSMVARLPTADGGTEDWELVAHRFPAWQWVVVGAQPVVEIEAVGASLRNRMLFGALLLAAVLCGLLWLVTRRIVVGPLARAVGSIEAVAGGRLDVRLPEDRGDEVGRLAIALNRMVGNLRERDDRDRALLAENSRVRQGLDKARTAVMLADADYRIVYCNEAVSQLLERAQESIRKSLPDFDAGQLIGGSIDQFHRKPEHQRGMLARMDKPHVARIKVGDSVMQLVLNPIDHDGARIGYVVEWHDRTQEVAIEEEVAGIVRAAAAGELDRRLSLEGKDGFFRELAGNLNALLAAFGDSLGEVQRVLAALAAGDLTQRVGGEHGGTLGRMREDTNRTVDELARIVAGIQQAAAAIGLAAREIAAGNSDLSVRTEQQAASLEEAASSLEELTATVRQNADNARAANQLVAGAGDVAGRGGAVVGQVVETMSGIDAASRRMGEIIGVIDGIAFQTNILALNAAVEAARAGEQGRGFAVVASEVRALAQRSAAAAKEIKGLIGDSAGRVGEGAQLVERAGRTMAEIVASVGKVSEIMGQISAASAEQSSGIEQVGQTVGQLDTSTQQNAALVEEAAASARSLEQQAEALQQAVSRFRLAAGADGFPASAATLPAPSVSATADPQPAAPAPAPATARPSAPPPARVATAATVRPRVASLAQHAEAVKPARPARAAPAVPRTPTPLRPREPAVQASQAASSAAVDPASAAAPAPSRPTRPASRAGDDLHWQEF